MPDFEEMKALEQKLARLMPTALSGEGQHSIEEMLDRLAVEAPAHQQPVRAAAWRKWGAGISGIAAALVAGVWVAQKIESPRGGALSVVADLPAACVQLVGEFDQVSEVAADGWREDPDGAALHVVRVSAVEQDDLLDEESGLVVQIVQPREEVILMPINTF